MNEQEAAHPFYRLATKAEKCKEQKNTYIYIYIEHVAMLPQIEPFCLLACAQPDNVDLLRQRLHRNKHTLCGLASL